MTGSRIAALRGRELLDSRGRPTVEVTVRLESGAGGSAIVPSGASTGRHEAVELRDADPARYGGLGVLRAVRNATDRIAPALLGLDALDQEAVDRVLVELDGTPDKSSLGANATLAASLAVARAAAAAVELPVWRYLAHEPPVMPMPMVNILSGGLHAGNRLAVQDFLVVPVGAAGYSSALRMCVAVHWSMRELLADRGLSTLRADEGGFGPDLPGHEPALDCLMAAIERAGFEPGREVAIAIDVAATHFHDPETGLYQLEPEGLRLPAAGLAELLRGWADHYPICSIEDGLAEDDWDGWRHLTDLVGGRVQLIGDDLFTTHPQRLRRGLEGGIANAVLVKMNQIGTLSETRQVIQLAREAGYATIVSARSGDTEDAFLADLAVAGAAGQIKVGSVTQSERLAKYNQLLRIEEELGPDAVFAAFGRRPQAPGRA